MHTLGYRVGDPAAFKRAMRQLITEKGGNNLRAAKAIGVARTTVSRLARGLHKTVAYDTAAKLSRAALSCVNGNVLEQQLGDALISRAAIRHFTAAYARWCAEYPRRREKSNVPTWRLDAARRPIRVNRTEALSWHRQELDDLQMLAVEEHRAQCEEFASWMRALGVDAERERIAFLRIMEPLAEATLSGYIERDWESLTTNERREFVKAGITREKILLNREHPLARARTVVSDGVPHLTSRREDPPESRYRRLASSKVWHWWSTCPDFPNDAEAVRTNTGFGGRMCPECTRLEKGGKPKRPAASR